jgi:hypothetical protein
MPFKLFLSLMLPVLLFFLIFNRGRERFLPRRRPKRSDFSVLLLLPA